MNSLLHWLLDYSVVFVSAVFLVLVASVFRPGRKERFRRHAMIPLQDDR